MEKVSTSIMYDQPTIVMKLLRNTGFFLRIRVVSCFKNKNSLQFKSNISRDYHHFNEETETYKCIFCTASRWCLIMTHLITSTEQGQRSTHFSRKTTPVQASTIFIKFTQQQQHTYHDTVVSDNLCTLCKYLLTIIWNHDLKYAAKWFS